MALMRGLPRLEVQPFLQGARVFLRYPQASDYEAWAAIRGASAAFLKPWEPTWPDDDLTRTAFRRRLRRYASDVRADTGYAFLVFMRGTADLVGGCTLSNVRRGVAQTCSLGYWAGEAKAGQGLMREAVEALLPFVFDRLGLHRIEAACLPENERSAALLERVGFRREGVARHYLRINGAWRDHLLFARLESDGR